MGFFRTIKETIDGIFGRLEGVRARRTEVVGGITEIDEGRGGEGGEIRETEGEGEEEEQGGLRGN